MALISSRTICARVFLLRAQQRLSQGDILHRRRAAPTGARQGLAVNEVPLPFEQPFRRSAQKGIASGRLQIEMIGKRFDIFEAVSAATGDWGSGQRSGRCCGSTRPCQFAGLQNIQRRLHGAQPFGPVRDICTAQVGKVSLAACSGLLNRICSRAFSRKAQLLSGMFAGVQQYIAGQAGAVRQRRRLRIGQDESTVAVRQPCSSTSAPELKRMPP